MEEMGPCHSAYRTDTIPQEPALDCLLLAFLVEGRIEARSIARARDRRETESKDDSRHGTGNLCVNAVFHPECSSLDRHGP